MAIGNRHYVKKHYQPELEFIKEHFDDLAQVWPRNTARVVRGSYVNVGLEYHVSAHTSAPHGVRFYKNGTWRPMSFYGRGCINPYELEKIMRAVTEATNN